MCFKDIIDLSLIMQPALDASILFIFARYELAAHITCVLPASDTTVKVGENGTMKRHAYSWNNTKFRTHLRRVHSGHYSDYGCQKLPGDELSAEIWQMRALVSIGYELIPKTSFWFWEWGGNEDLVQPQPTQFKLNNWKQMIVGP